MKFAVVLVTVVVIAFSTGHGNAQSTMCQLDRRAFELLVTLRMRNYELTGDSWAPRATRWRNEISANIAAGRTTPSLDGVFARYTRYCSENDAFMAGLIIGEWVGIGLRAP